VTILWPCRSTDGHTITSSRSCAERTATFTTTTGRGSAQRKISTKSNSTATDYAPHRVYRSCHIKIKFNTSIIRHIGISSIDAPCTGAHLSSFSLFGHQKFSHSSTDCRLVVCHNVLYIIKICHGNTVIQ
jgi:hypothetical protein